MQHSLHRTLLRIIQRNQGIRHRETGTKRGRSETLRAPITAGTNAAAIAETIDAATTGINAKAPFRRLNFRLRKKTGKKLFRKSISTAD
jgi:hypothetical protein